MSRRPIIAGWKAKESYQHSPYSEETKFGVQGQPRQRKPGKYTRLSFVTLKNCKQEKERTRNKAKTWSNSAPCLTTLKWSVPTVLLTET